MVNDEERYYNDHQRREGLMPGASAGKPPRRVIYAVVAFDTADDPFLQGAFYTREDARRLKERIVSHGYDAQILETYLFTDVATAWGAIDESGGLFT